MNTQEACVKIRGAGLHVTQETLQLGLQQGVLPFGVAIKGPKRWKYFISESELDEWLKKFSTG